MTKAAQIIALDDGIRTTREIAALVGCRPEYVRVCARQRKGGTASANDRRYNESFRAKHGITRDGFLKRQRRQDPAYRAKETAYARAYYRRKKAEREGVSA